MITIKKLWYQDRVILWPLIPFSIIFSWLVFLRRKTYQFGIRAQKHFPLPVIVVGNITVGGTGKTPLVIHIAEYLSKQGYIPGIVSRGYKGTHSKPMLVTETSDPVIVGDEAIMMAKRLQCPIVVSQDRCLALDHLLKTQHVNVIISDDGLQHYALRRHIEIAVIDGQRRFGNGYCLPAGPLREPESRLQSVDLIINNGGTPKQDEYSMQYSPSSLYNASNNERQQTLDSFGGNTVHAIAGLGNPSRFIQLLKSFDINVIEHIFPDHHLYQPSEIYFKDDCPIIMTEKDAVKCTRFMSAQHWILPIKALVNPLFDAQLLTLLKEHMNG